jgi:hypothetical protein
MPRRTPQDESMAMAIWIGGFASGLLFGLHNRWFFLFWPASMLLIIYFMKDLD